MTRPSSTGDDANPPAVSPLFTTTRWSVVLSAKGKDSPEAAGALEYLCRAYWYPLYAHVRRTGCSPADAEDLTQGFFARLLEKDWLDAADRERGRFRSFLLASLNHFLANEWDRGRAQKRGGRFQIVSLDALAGEERFRHEPATTATPDRDFDRRWALTLLEAVLARLKREYVENAKAHLFEQLKGTLSGDRSGIPYATLSRELAMSEGAVRVAAYRLRRRYRELLRQEIAGTVVNPGEVEDELRCLFAALPG
ncbi:MAG TPA: RNA polymerase subunit sigma-24 [Verrucomicrobiales bacterium]|nr:RNA polymerase subunit sigma-24 [Verrucomicrobiales bacterium]